MVDAGDHVFVRVRLRGEGRESGVELEQLYFHVWEVRDGKAFRCRVYTDESEAKAAAGLP